MDVFRLFKNELGEVSAGNIVGSVIAIAIGLIVISAIMPTAIDQLYAADTTDWTINGTEDVRTTSMWELLPMFVVLSVLLIIIAVALKYV